ncbi:hypothetical protein Tco_0530870 [Tanacetum coccineum]
MKFTTLWMLALRPRKCDKRTKRVERLMRGTIQNQVDRETHFTNEFDQFVAEPGEALVSIYNRFALLMKDLEGNKIIFPIITVNTKFLKSLKPEWLKYVTQVRLAKRLIVDLFDDLFDYLHQFEKLVNASRAKKLEKSHDPLLPSSTHTGFISRNTHLIYGNTSYVVGDRVNIQSKNSGNTGRNTRRAYVQEEVVEGSNAQNESENVQRTLQTSSAGNVTTVQCYTVVEKDIMLGIDEAGVIFTDEQNDFLFADALRMEEIKELSANIFLMARIQPANNTSDVGPSYDSAFISEVQSSSIKDNQEQMYPTHTKIINSIIGDDQIDSNIILGKGYK